MRDALMLPEVANALPRIPADGVGAATIALKLSIPELLAQRALNRLVTAGAAKCAGAFDPLYWRVDEGVIPVEAVKLDPGADPSDARTTSSSGRGHGTGMGGRKIDPNAKRIPLSAMQAYFRIVEKRARGLFGRALEAGDAAVKRRAEKTGARAANDIDAKLIDLRISYLAHEQAMELIDAEIARLTRQADAKAPRPVAKREPAPPAAKALNGAGQ